MRSNLITGFAGLCLLFSSAVQAAPFAYTADGDSSGGNLYRIDLANNALTTVGPITGRTIESLAFGPGPILYGISQGDQDLLSIDTSTGASTVIGALGVSVDDPGMAYCLDNSTMYLADESGELYSVDLATGAATLIGTDTVYQPTGMTCSQAGVLYATSDSSDSLYTVDRTTGLSTLVGALGINISDGGLARNGAQLLMVSDNSPTNLYELDLATGAATIITQLDANNLSLESLSIDTEAGIIPSTPRMVPTLSLWAFPLLISLLMLIGKRRRK